MEAITNFGVLTSALGKGVPSREYSRSNSKSQVRRSHISWERGFTTSNFINNNRPIMSCNSQESESTDEPVVFDPKNNIAEPPPEWKDWEERKMQEELDSNGGIAIRRRPATGPPLHYVGPFEFRLQNKGNTPRNILEEIVWNKEKEVTQIKERKPLVSLKKGLPSAPPARDFIGALRARAEETGMPALIAEVKKASPSRGVIQPNFDPIKIAQAYEKGGAACISVLTDSKYFQGSFENLQAIRDAGIECPLLCKEFIIDAWQLYHARLKGADAVLLIAGILPDRDLKYMSKICKVLQMASLVEVHNVRELDRVLEIDGIELIGINNRSLETFDVDIKNTEHLLQGDRGQRIRDRDILVVGESGLLTPDDIAFVTLICPFLSISTQPSYTPRVISESPFEHSHAYFDSSGEDQYRDRNPGQEQSTISFASEQNQSENDCHGTDRFNSKRENTLCYITENSCEAQAFSHMQLNNAINDGTQSESQVLSQSMIDEMSTVHGLKPFRGLENGNMAACIPDEIQGRQDFVSLQIDSSETKGTVSSYHGQQMRNIGDSEQIVELSSALDKFHSGLTASGIIGTGISLNLDGQERLDVISSTDNADRNESLDSNLILSCNEDEKYALEGNVPSCERTDEDRSLLVVQYVRNAESSFTANTGRNSDDTSIKFRE